MKYLRFTLSTHAMTIGWLTDNSARGNINLGQCFLEMKTSNIPKKKDELHKHVEEGCVLCLL